MQSLQLNMTTWLLLGTAAVFLAGCDQQTDDPAAIEPSTVATAAVEHKEQLMSKEIPQLPTTHPQRNPELAQRYAEIKALIGDAKASEVQQCRKVAFGYKACGGPASYLIYSVQGLDEAVLLQKVAQYNELAKAESKRLGLMSDCAMVMEPSVSLVGGVCKAGGTGDLF